MSTLVYSPALQSILVLVGGMLVLLAGVPFFGTRRGAVSLVGLLIALGSLLPAQNAEGLELVAILGVSLTLMFGAALNIDLELDEHQPQYLESMALPLIAGVGVLTMAIAHNLFELAIGLEFPWGLTFLPDAGILVTEKPGRLLDVLNGHGRAARVTYQLILPPSNRCCNAKRIRHAD